MGDDWIYTCIVHGNELISKMKSSNRLGFFSMARYGHPPYGKIFITSENVFPFSKYFVDFFFTKNIRLLSPPNVLLEMYYSHVVGEFALDTNEKRLSLRKHFQENHDFDF